MLNMSHTIQITSTKWSTLLEWIGSITAVAIKYRFHLLQIYKFSKYHFVISTDHGNKCLLGLKIRIRLMESHQNCSTVGLSTSARTTDRFCECETDTTFLEKRLRCPFLDNTMNIIGFE